MTTDHKAQVEAAREECHRLVFSFQESLNRDIHPASSIKGSHILALEKLFSAIDRLAALASAPPAPASEKIAPVQGWPAGIPWSLHLEAYAVYCKRWSPQPALIDLEGRNCRGGFTVGELDEFIPGWRGRVSEITKLKADAPPAPAASEPVVRRVQAYSCFETGKVFKHTGEPRETCKQWCGYEIPPLPETLKQIVYALQRQANALQAQADKMSDQLDYSAEFFAEDAQRMREAIQILQEKS